MKQDWNKQDPNAWLRFYQQMVEARDERERAGHEASARWAIQAYAEMMKDMDRPEYVRAIAQMNRDGVVTCLRQYVSTHDAERTSWQARLLKEHGLAF